MKYVLLLAAAMAAFAGSPHLAGLRLVDRLDECIQRRFHDPLPETLGMSRVVAPASFGSHFRPNTSRVRDFEPGNSAEREVVAALEQRHMQVGFYLIGKSIAGSQPPLLDFRALKGPAAITAGTPRPTWYPSLIRPVVNDPNSLPDWDAIFSLAQKTMREFDDGRGPFETTVGIWHIAARPVMASEQRCVACHTNRAYPAANRATPGKPIGGILYAFRTGN